MTCQAQNRRAKRRIALQRVDRICVAALSLASAVVSIRICSSNWRASETIDTICSAALTLLDSSVPAASFTCSSAGPHRRHAGETTRHHRERFRRRRIHQLEAADHAGRVLCARLRQRRNRAVFTDGELDLRRHADRAAVTLHRYALARLQHTIDVELEGAVAGIGFEPSGICKANQPAPCTAMSSGRPVPLIPPEEKSVCVLASMAKARVGSPLSTAWDCTCTARRRCSSAL